MPHVILTEGKDLDPLLKDASFRQHGKMHGLNLTVPNKHCVKLKKHPVSEVLLRIEKSMLVCQTFGRFHQAYKFTPIALFV